MSRDCKWNLQMDYRGSMVRGGSLAYVITSFSKVGWRVSLSLSSTLASIIVACFHKLYTVCPPQIPPLRWRQHQPRNAPGILSSFLGSQGTAPAHCILVTEASSKTPAIYHRGCIDVLSTVCLWFLKSCLWIYLLHSSHGACHTSKQSHSDLPRSSSLGIRLSDWKLAASSSNPHRSGLFYDKGRRHNHSG